MKAQLWLIYPMETNPVATIQETGWAPRPVLPSAEIYCPHQDSHARPSTHSKLLYLLCWPSPKKH